VLIVRGRTQATDVDCHDLHVALRASDWSLARDAFGVICNCAGAWEDDSPRSRARIRSRSRNGWSASSTGVSWVDEDGELKTSV
jgi:hypothetical protein